MESKLTRKGFEELVKKVEAGKIPSQSDYIFFVPQIWVDKMPEYFYRDNSGQLWFETPWTCRTKAQIIPYDKGILMLEEDIKPTIHKAIYTAFTEIGEL